MIEIKIANKIISKNSKIFVIAELSANHLQEYDIAVKTIEAIKKSGADAVKVQTYTPDTITMNCNSKYFQINDKTIWDGETLYELYRRAYMPWAWQPKLKKIAEDLGLVFFSSPFDKTAVDFLEKMNVPAYKIASFEITDIPLIKYVASKGKPIIISTGIATLQEIKIAINACKQMKNKQIVLLKCTSAYPTPFSEVNLKTISSFMKKFKILIGLSDHTLGISIPIAAAALGAKIIEKHFILDKKLGGPDSKFSLEPEEFKNMVINIREVEEALGKVSYTKKNNSNRKFARSLFVVKDIIKGESLTENNIKSIRPNYGLGPKYFDYILGKKVNKNIKKGTPLRWSLIEAKRINT